MKQLFTFLGPWRMGALVLCALLSGLGLFLKFGIPGYSFSSLVCFCLVALILFYAFFPLVGLKFPAFAKVVTTAVTVCVVMGLLVVGITEGIIIAASFGSPKEPVEYVVVLGAKVNQIPGICQGRHHRSHGLCRHGAAGGGHYRGHHHCRQLRLS